MASASTSQGNEWRYVANVSITHNITNAIENPISCVKFDPHEELLWYGTVTGKVSSVLPPSYNRYSGFKISNVSSVHCVEPVETLVFSLTDRMLRTSTKQGIPIAKFCSPSMNKMRALCHMPGTSNFIIGGLQDKLIHYDYVKEKEIRTTVLSQNESARIIRYNGSSTFTADCNGNVYVKNSKNCETIHKIECHSQVLDFDVQGSKLITCGLTLNRMKNMDQYVKVFDLRMYKALNPIQIPLNPQFVRFMPSYCERICVMYQAMIPSNIIPQSNWLPAGVRMFDLNSNGNCIDFIAEATLNASFDFSSNKNMIAIGNNCGVIGIFADREHPTVNDNSKETFFAAPPVQPPISFAIDDTTQTFGSIPLGFSREPLLSDWPTDLTQIAYRRRKPVEYTNVKTIHYASQCVNPRMNSKLRLHNIVPYILEREEPVMELSENENLQTEPSKVLEKAKVPKLYKKRPLAVNQVPNRRGSADDASETYTWNVIHHVTMQSTYAMNLLANTLVQVIYSLSPIRNIVLGHICANDSCITCELHFLFTAFSSKHRQSTGITTTNLAFSLARNGVSLKSGGVLSAIQQIIHVTLQDLSAKDSLLSITSTFDRYLRCIRCRGLQSKETDTPCLHKLNYDNIHQASLCQLIEKSLHLGGNENEKECEECKHTSRMECKRKIRKLAPVLLIDTNTSSKGFVDFWRRQLTLHESRPGENQAVGSVPESPSEKKHCRYGMECRNKKKCKFIHGRIDWTAEQSKLLEDIDLNGWSHYIPSRIAVQICEGIVRLSDISDLKNYDEPSAMIYELDAMIHVVGNGENSVNWTHPVTLLRENPAELASWTLINEQLVSSVHDHEARHVDGRWKLPALLAYKQKGFEADVCEQSVSDELFFDEKNLAVSGATSLAVQAIDELPKEKELVGLDAEFIKIKTDLLEFNGKSVLLRAVGRASCVESDGEKIIFDDHVELTDDVEVVDYLTRYSGIVESDLNSKSSDKFLTTHKRLILRMHVLIQRGVIFVGHALHNDFTVLNVHVAEHQIYDTVHLLRLGSQRMLSLQFLVKEILGETIQSAEHDSVVDARYALKLYRKSLEIKAQGLLHSEMRRIYAILPCPSPNQTTSPLVVLTQSKTPDETNPVEAAPRSV